MNASNTPSELIEQAQCLCVITNASATDLTARIDKITAGLGRVKSPQAQALFEIATAAKEKAGGEKTQLAGLLVWLSAIKLGWL